MLWEGSGWDDGSRNSLDLSDASQQITETKSGTVIQLMECLIEEISNIAAEINFFALFVWIWSQIFRAAE